MLTKILSKVTIIDRILANNWPNQHVPTNKAIDRILLIYYQIGHINPYSERMEIQLGLHLFIFYLLFLLICM